MQSVTVSSAPGATGSWSDPIDVWRESQFDISITGTFSATVWLQRCFHDDDRTVEANWKDVSSYTTATEAVCTTGSKTYWRIGVKSGGWVSGSVTCTLVR